MDGDARESVGAGGALRRIDSPDMGPTSRLAVHGLSTLVLADQLNSVAVARRRCEIEGRGSYQRQRRSVQPRRLAGLTEHWCGPKGATPRQSRPRRRCG